MQLPLNNNKQIEGLTLIGSSSISYLPDGTATRTKPNLSIEAYVVLGLVLLALYLAQELLDSRWEYLDKLQDIDSYKKWSGFVLGSYMLLQWSLTWVRIIPKFNGVAETFVSIHKWMGAISPVFFYAHALRFGYAYLFFLSCLFFTNIVIGYLNPDKISFKANWYLQGWMILHVTVSVLVTLLMFYHGFMAFYFK